jgi:hypothetical protein
MTESADIVHVPMVTSPRLLNPMDIEPSEFQGALARRSANRKALMDWINANLVESVDFGRIHVVRKDKCRETYCTYEKQPYHWSKPNLFKAGAEKIAGMLGIRADFPALREYERAAIEGREIKNIVLCCDMLDTEGRIIGQGVGARCVADDYGDLNKALKMAKKSAHVDATLSTGGLSESFTQGLEDLPPARREEVGTSHDEVDLAPPPQAPAPNTAPQPLRRSPSGSAYPVTPGQVRLLQVRLDRAGIPEQELLAKFEVESLEAFPKGRVDEALKWMEQIAP